MQNLPLDEMQEFIVEKTRRVAEIAGDRLPESVKANGEIRYIDNVGWTGGFWTGLLNYCYLFTGDEKFFEYAEKSRFRFLDRLYKAPDTLDQDVGFIYIPSEYARYKFQGKEESLKVVLDAVEIIAKRYKPEGRYIRAWNDWGCGTMVSVYNHTRLIVDSMFNLPILYLASEITGDPKYADIANAHAETVSKTAVREDGTTFHTYIFKQNGEPDFGQTFQGYSDESCWSRGQTWVLGGFAMAYRFSGKKEFLEVSKKAADKFIELLEPDYIPMWDFIFKGSETEPRDASAAAIGATGLLELASHCEGEEKERYTKVAENIILSLWENGYVTRNRPDFPGLIERCVGWKAGGSYTEGESLNYADYYFAEAVAKLKGIDIIL